MLRPTAAPLMRMRWRHLLFAHWPVDAAMLRPLVPCELEIDTFEGTAWVGLVPFTMEDVNLSLLPRLPRGLRWLTDFHECNVRTYVYPRGVEPTAESRGVWFFSLDAANRLAVLGARASFHLPYFDARMHLHREGDVIDYHVQRLATWNAPRTFDGDCPLLDCRWQALEQLPATRLGERAHFLTERYCLYAMRGRTLCRGRIEHEPWPLRNARLISLNDSLVSAAGITIDPAHTPLLHHADRLEVRAHLLERV